MRPNSKECPENIRQSIERYVNDKCSTGGFLRAVLENNLKESMARADEDNLDALPHIVAFCYNKIPQICWGSPKNVENWLNPEKEEGSE